MYVIDADGMAALDRLSRTWRLELYKNGELVEGIDVQKITPSYKNSSDNILGIGDASSTCVSIQAKNLHVRSGTVFRLLLKLNTGGSEYEDIPLGEYTVEESSNQEIECYDAMYTKGSKAYKAKVRYPTSVRASIGDVAQQMGLNYDVSNIPSGLLSQQVPLTPNGYKLREVAGFLAACVAGFAYIDRSGALKFARPASGSSLQLDEDHYREDNLSISDNEINVQSVVWEDMNGNTHTIGTGTAITINNNPLMTQSIFSAISSYIIGIQYTPLNVQMLGYPILDPEDMIVLHRSSATYRCICKDISHTFDGGLTSNVSASTKNEVDNTLSLSSLLDKVNSDELVIHHYVNTAAILISNGNKITIIDISYGTKKDTTISLSAEIQLNVECVEDAAKGINDALATITYNNAGEDLTCEPVETYLDGSHILHLIQKIQVEANTLSNLTVSLTATGGNFIIPVGSCKAWLEGTGLVAENQWDGIIRLTDIWTAVDFPDDISEQGYSDINVVRTHIPIGSTITEQIQAVQLAEDIDAISYTESIQEVFDE